MSLSLVLLALAAAGALAFGVSACVFALLRAHTRALDALTPAAQARVWLGAALLPCLVTLASMTAAMAPSFGWIADHCDAVRDVHSHPHLCVPHHEPSLPAWPLLVLAAAFSLRLALGAIQVGRSVALAARGRRSLELSSTRDASGTLRVLALAEPQAFVIGFVRPEVYVTRGLLSRAHAEHLPAVLAHEHAHVRRADPLRRLLCRSGLLFHAPGIAGALDRRLARALEMAADASAADQLGSRERVACALVHLTRARSRLPHAVLPFGTSDLESRVQRLLSRPREWDFPGSPALFGALGALIALIALSAGSVHHGVEMLLGVFGG